MRLTVHTRGNSGTRPESTKYEMSVTQRTGNYRIIGGRRVKKGQLFGGRAASRREAVLSGLVWPTTSKTGGSQSNNDVPRATGENSKRDWALSILTDSGTSLPERSTAAPFDRRELQVLEQDSNLPPQCTSRNSP